MLRRSISIVAWSLAFLLVALAATWIVARQLREQPLDSLHRALDKLAAAQADGADRDAPQLYRQAEACLRTGKEALRSINESWWPFGDYSVADSLLKESARLSELAATSVADSSSRKRAAVTFRIGVLEDSLSEWNRILAADLSRTDFKVMHRAASAKLELASRLAKEGALESAEDNLDSVESILTKLSSLRSAREEDERKRSARMQEWVDETLKYSRKNGKIALIADKKAHKLRVVKNGRVIESLDCDLGYNAGYQKLRAGDGATPEGMYKVTEVKRQSKYYRALLLNYPNKTDRERFKNNLAAGIIPPGSKIGGLIEIHGHGARNEDWTDGCIALDNKDMDKLMKLCPKGTPVTIVRSWDSGR